VKQNRESKYSVAFTENYFENRPFLESELIDRTNIKYVAGCLNNFCIFLHKWCAKKVFDFFYETFVKLADIHMFDISENSLKKC